MIQTWKPDADGTGILERDGERIATDCADGGAKFEVMARMGVYFEEEVQRRYPEFPTRRGSGVGRLPAADERGAAGVGAAYGRHEQEQILFLRLRSGLE